MQTKKLLVECGSCGGTGLYQGFAEEKNYPVVCVRCRGTGHGSGTKEFTGRKTLPGIRGVRINPTGTILTCDRNGSTMSYEQFRASYPSE